MNGNDYTISNMPIFIKEYNIPRKYNNFGRNIYISAIELFQEFYYFILETYFRMAFLSLTLESPNSERSLSSISERAATSTCNGINKVLSI